VLHCKVEAFRFCSAVVVRDFLSSNSLSLSLSLSLFKLASEDGVPEPSERQKYFIQLKDDLFAASRDHTTTADKVLKRNKQQTHCHNISLIIDHGVARLVLVLSRLKENKDPLNPIRCSSAQNRFGYKRN
jgi:hypothetical protein